MHSQAVNSESLPARDASKRKRLNRTAKLKQYKLDARREQWLAQGKNCSRSDQDLHQQDWKEPDGKESESSLGLSGQESLLKSQGSTQTGSKNSSEEFTGSVTEESDDESSIINPEEEPVGSNDSQTRVDGDGCIFANNGLPEGKSNSTRETKSVDFRSCSFESRAQKDQKFDRCSKHNGLKNFVRVKAGMSGNGKDKRKTSETRNTAQSNHAAGEGLLELKQRQDQVKDWLKNDLVACLSDENPIPAGSRVVCISSTRVEGEGSVEEEDWEAAADALCARAPLKCKESSTSDAVRQKGQQSIQLEGGKPKGSTKGIHKADVNNSILKPDYKVKSNPFLNRSKSCAWRPDDLARPPTLPSLSNCQSTRRDYSSLFWSPVYTKSVWPAPSTPSECPICAEELDTTDSSFVPCSCGFRPCLFCVHRIASEDGRCPACRREYNFDTSLKSVQSSSVQFRA